MKVCSKCNMPGRFYKSSSKSDGLHSCCVECEKKQQFLSRKTVFRTEKRCPGCGETKPSSEWYTDSSAKDGLDSCCKACHRERARKKYLENPAKALAANKKWRINNPLECRKHDLKKVGLTPEEYDRFLEESKGVCKICKRDNKPLFADHNHKTKKFRAFLCLACNTALGKFQDCPKMLRAAADYLENHP